MVLLDWEAGLVENKASAKLKGGVGRETDGTGYGMANGIRRQGCGI